jgi:DNA-directed RNA polymerase subunit M/transcription elongation factor TFIIS
MIKFACPGCSATFTVADEKAGKSGKCPKCQSEFVIPAAEGAPPVADIPPPLPPVQPPPLPGGDPPRTGSPPDPNQPVEIQPCPKCGSRLSVLPADVGVEIQCPSCDTVFKALRADAPPPPDSGSRSKRSSELVKVGSGSRREDDEEERPSRRRSRREDDEDDRPSRRRRRDDDDDEDDRPSRRRSRRDDDEDEDDRDADYRPSRRSRRSRYDDDYGRGQRPSQIQTLGLFLLIGGIMACMYTVGLGLGTYCLWPGAYYELVFGIMAIVKGSQMMGQNDPPDPPRGLFIMAIICIINCDVLNMVFGIVGLNMLNSPEVQDYYNRR